MTKIFIVEDHFAQAHSLKLILQKAGYEVCGIEASMDAALEGIMKEKPQLVLLDIFLKGNGTGIDLAGKIKERGIAFVYISANFDSEILAAAKETQPYGFLIKPFRDKDVLVTIEIALFRHQYSLESNYHKIELIHSQLEDAHLADNKEGDLFLRFGRILQPHIPFDFMTISTATPDTDFIIIDSYRRVAFNEYQRIGLQEWLTITGLKQSAFVALQKTLSIPAEPGYFNGESFEQEMASSKMIKTIERCFDVNSLFRIPVFSHVDLPVQVNLFNRRPDVYNKGHLDMIGFLRNALQNFFKKSITSTVGAVANPSTTKINAPSARRNTGSVFPGIIGMSHGLLTVFDNITQVAPFDTSVLILGESGTGKERVAECIQHLSARKGKAFVKVNCAALPPSLVESELFGHEKGAFTGAAEAHIGHFEQAANGTIFLDEIGELPLDVQVKLLRVLQEKEIRRVGGKSTIKVNVRVIAATNRNLEELVTQGSFRLDLYYRLNVFPIQLPPLRERREDIPLLANYFIKKYAEMTGKKIEGLSENALQELMEYNWPGNIRELENLMERCVLRSSGSSITEVNLAVNTLNVKDAVNVAESFFKTIEENEREYILSILKKCNGRVWGKNGAAALLKMPPTTLNSKIKKLGIKREFIG